MTLLSDCRILVPAPRHRPYVSGDSLDHAFPFVWVVRGVFSHQECRELIDRIEGVNPETGGNSTGLIYEVTRSARSG